MQNGRLGSRDIRSQRHFIFREQKEANISVYRRDWIGNIDCRVLCLFQIARNVKIIVALIV